VKKFLLALILLGIVGTAGAVIKSIGSIPFATGVPNARTLSLATAYQATDVNHPSVVVINLTSTAAITLSGGQTHSADILIGSTNAVASGTGTIVGKYSNSSTGTVVIGIAMNTASATPVSFVLPAGWFFAVRQTLGTITITSAFDQSLG
jgi:hypothetical protein